MSDAHLLWGPCHQPSSGAIGNVDAEGNAEDEEQQPIPHRARTQLPRYGQEHEAGCANDGGRCDRAQAL